MKATKLWSCEVPGKGGPVTLMLCRLGREYRLDARWADNGIVLTLVFGKRPDQQALDLLAMSYFRSDARDVLREFRRRRSEFAKKGIRIDLPPETVFLKKLTYLQLSNLARSLKLPLLFKHLNEDEQAMILAFMCKKLINARDTVTTEYYDWLRRFLGNRGVSGLRAKGRWGLLITDKTIPKAHWPDFQERARQRKKIGPLLTEGGAVKLTFEEFHLNSRKDNIRIVLKLRVLVSETDKEATMLARHRTRAQQPKKGAVDGFSYALRRLDEGTEKGRIAFPMQPSGGKEMCCVISDQAAQLMFKKLERHEGLDFRPISPLTDAPRGTYGYICSRTSLGHAFTIFSQDRERALSIASSDISVMLKLLDLFIEDQTASSSFSNVQDRDQKAKTMAIVNQSEHLVIVVKRFSEAIAALKTYGDYLCAKDIDATHSSPLEEEECGPASNLGQEGHQS